MAYLANYLDEDEKKKAEEAKGGTTPRSTSGVVDSTTPTGPAPAGGAPAAAAAPTPGTGFVNLQQYLDMNQGEGARLAGAATKGLVDEVGSFKDTATKTVNEGATQIKAGAKDADAKQVIQGVVSDASAAQDAAKDFLGSGYEGPAAADLTAGLAATKNDLTSKLSTVDNAANVASSLAATYGNKQPYTGGFGLLDSFLVGGTQSGRNTLAGVKAKAGEVEKTLGSTQATLTAAEETAKKKLESNKQAIINTAKQSQGNILGSLEKEAAKLTSTANPNAKGVKAASIGDVINDDQKADLDALTAILNGDSIDYGSTFNAGSVPATNTPAGEVVVPPPPSGEDTPPPPPSNDGELPPALDATSQALGAAAKAGADVSNAVKKLNEPNVQMTDSIGNFLKNPTPEAAMDMLKKAGIAPFATTYNAVQLATDLTRQLKGRAVEDLNRAFPGIGAGLGTTLDMAGGKMLDLASPQLPDIPTKPKVSVNVKAPPLKKAPKIMSSSDILKKASEAKGPKLPKVPSWAPKGADPNLFDGDGKLVGDPSKLVAGMSIGDLNKLSRKLKDVGISNTPIGKAVSGAIADSKKKTDAIKAQGAAEVKKAEDEAKKLADQAIDAAKHAGGVVSDEAKKLGGKVAKEVKKYVPPALKKKKLF